MKYLKIAVLIFVFVAAFSLRLPHLYEKGKDHETYKRAVVELLSGINPYEFTIRSFSLPNYKGDSGFSYLPGFLYLYSPIYMLGNSTGWNEALLWKIPVLVADFSVALIIFMKLKSEGFLPAVLGSSIWLFNPYLLQTSNYTYLDPLAVLFMLLALRYLEKDEVLAGAFFALAVGFKSFPILLLPIFLYHSRDKLKFLVAGGMVGFALVVPFLKTIDDFLTLLKGSLLVHGGRGMQGRPFLFYISYMYGLEIFQIIPIWVYTTLASFSGWIATMYFMFKRKITEKYLLSLIPFGLFYIFTPVLNRTYILWALPILAISLALLFSKQIWKYYVSLAGIYLFYYLYLVQWVDGFHVKVPTP